MEYEVEEESQPKTKELADISLLDDFAHLLDSSEDADVVFNVKGERIAAHKLILKARSPYFKAMFQSRMKESLSQSVDIDDAEPNVFRGLLRFLYIGQPPVDLSAIAWDLLSLADKYGVEKLKLICESRLSDNLDDNNAIDALLVAERHKCVLLMERARCYVKDNFRSLRENKENWAKLKDDSDLLLKLFEFACE